MSDMLILMRHGKAERPELDQSDKDRELTERGRRALRATLPRSLKMMPAGATVCIMTSPAARAEQTAQVMLEACKDAGIDVHSELQLVDALWAQDFDDVIAQVRACDADVVVAVGHNPFIEEATKELTGSRIIFATGAFAAVALPPDIILGEAAEGSEVEGSPQLSAQPSEPVSGRLLWFAQGPISQRWKTLVNMERALRKAAGNVQARLDAFMADPDDVETMHKFRVSIRTLRSLLAFVSPWQQPGQNKTCQENLKRIVGETSYLRELDVLADDAAAMEGASPELAAFCAQKAEEERQRVLKVLSSKRISKLLDETVKEVNRLKWRKRVEAQGMDAAEVRARFDELVAELEDNVVALNLADEEATHDVRKDAKRVRYDAENYKSLIGADAVPIAKEAIARQDDLGAVCDARANIRLISSFEEQGPPEPVAWGLALLRAQNETMLYTTLCEGQSATPDEDVPE